MDVRGGLLRKLSAEKLVLLNAFELQWMLLNAFELRCWRRLLRVPWTARRSNQSILKEISPEYSLEGLMLKLKLQYFGHWYEELTPRKDPDAGKDWRQEENGTTEDEMVEWHHQLNGNGKLIWNRRIWLSRIIIQEYCSMNTEKPQCFLAHPTCWFHV